MQRVLQHADRPRRRREIGRVLAFVLDLLEHAHRPVEQQVAPLEQMRMQPRPGRAMHHQPACLRQRDRAGHDLVEYAAQPFAASAGRRRDIERRERLECAKFRQQLLLDRARFAHARHLQQQAPPQIEIREEASVQGAPALDRIACETDLEPRIVAARDHVDESPALRQPSRESSLQFRPVVHAGMLRRQHALRLCASAKPPAFIAVIDGL
jgi:hypothetical protein